MKLLKRIGALVLAVALIIGSLPMANLSVKAGIQHNSSLELFAPETFGTRLIMKGTDDLLKTEAVSDVVLDPVDENSGAYLNGVKTNEIWFFKSDTANDFYEIGGITDVINAKETAVAGSSVGTTITIKGSFKCQKQDLYGDDTITFEEATFVYDGSIWSKKTSSVNKYNSSLELLFPDTELARLILKGTDDLLNSTTVSVVLAPVDENSGVYLNGQKTNEIWFAKSEPNNGFYEVVMISDVIAAKEAATVGSSVGTTITIKGTFKCQDQATYGDDTITFEEATFVYNGTKWSKKKMDATEFKATSFGDVVTQPTYVQTQGAWHVYLKTDVALPEASNDLVSGFQVAVNDGAVVGVDAYTDSNGGLIICIPDTALPSSLASDTTVTLKAGEATAVSGGQKYKLTQDFSMYFTSADSAWSTKLYDKITFTGCLDNSTCVENAGGEGIDMWSIFLNTSDELSIAPGTGSYSGLKGKVEVGQRTEDISITLSSEATKLGWFSIWSPTLSKEDEQTGFKITIYKGKAEPSNTNCNGFELTEDFTLYRNQYGWSTTGFIQSTVYKSFKFTDDVSATYTAPSGADEGRWNVFLNTSEILPGTAGASQYFTGIKAKLQIGEGAEQEIAINIWNEEESKVWIPIYDVKQDIDAIEKFKLTICKGKADSSVTTNDGIELTEDITIYVNKYDASTEGFAAPPVYKEFKFTDEASATYTALSGADEGRWNVFLNTSVILPGTAGAGQYFTGIKAKLQIGDGAEQEIPINIWNEEESKVWIPLYDVKQDIDTIKNFKLTICKGKAESSVAANAGIELTEEVTIYVNEHGVLTTGYAKPKNYKTFTFKDVDLDNTKYTPGTGADEGRWDVFLKTSAKLPGTSGKGQYFTGIKAKLQIGEGKVQEIAVNVWNEKDSIVWIPVYELKQDLDTIKNFKLTICKGKADSSVASNDGIELTKDFTIYVNEHGISTEGYVKAPIYDKITFTGYREESGCVVNADGEGNDMWSFLLATSKNLSINPKEGSYSGLKVKLEIGGVKSTTDITLVSEADKVGWFSIWSPTLTKADEAKGIKLTVCKGTAKASVAGRNGIELTEDFTIYINQYGWSTTGFMKEPVYTKFTFNSINSITEFNEKESAWDIYLSPSTTLPGTADSTLFKGIQMSVNGGKAFDLNIVKSAYAGTAFARVTSDNLPEDITSNTKIVIKAGKANSKDGQGIWLTQDFVIYANQYGWSTTNYLSAPTIKQTDAKLELDRAVSYGGSKDGIYLTTTDIFPVDTSWGTHIKAVGYEATSGIFLNGEKLKSASIIRYIEGKAYISLSDIGLQAKDHDVLTVKGTFALNGTGVVYAEANFHFNGKIWGNTYEAPKPETYKQFNITGVNLVSGYLDSQKQWNLYFDVDTMLPGNIDQMHFSNFTVQIGSKTITTWAAHSYNHTLYIPISAEDLAKDCPDGTQITIKAGKALGDDQSSGIKLMKDFIIYTYKGSIFTEKPTTNTDWQDVSVSQLIRTGSFNKDAECWQMFIKLQEELKTESGTRYLQFPILINGKEHQVTAVQEGIYLYVPIASSILPENTKSATITIKAGAKSTANAGYNGIKFKEEWNAYLFNGAISEVKFTEVEETETAIIGLQAVTADPTVSHVYLRLSKEFPGTSWYEYYNDFVYYYNGKKIETYICKADSSNGKVMYFTIDTNTLGEPKEGDIIEILDGEDITCGGYHVTLTKGFKMLFKDGVWSEYVESNVQKPADSESLWSLARFDSAYIPVAEEDGAVLFSGEDKYPQMESLKKMKDFTVSFTSKKAYDDEIANTFKVILRGNPISETDEMTSTLLYGYVITFSPMQIPNPLNPEEMVWSGYLELWKNGENMSLTDQYRIHYEHERVNNPFFKYNEEYDYEFSIYNVTETIVCIEAKVNGVTIMRHYDEASSDPMDPAVNEGTFAVIGTGPNYIKDDIVELDAVIAEKDECETGEKVRVAATYPSVIKGAEFTVDKKGATVEDGVFKADKAGTYTISCTYNGKKLETKTITVTKAEKADVGTANIPIIPVVIGTVSTLLLASIIVFVVIKNKKKKQSAE